MQKKIFIYLWLILLNIFACSSINSHKIVVSNNDAIIDYVPFHHHKNGSFMRLDAVINDSIYGTFDFDSGLTGWDMKIDSAFFFTNFDVSTFKHEKQPFKMTFYQGTFIGKFKISVGNHTFEIEKILVENLHDPDREGNCGIIGSKMLENKVTIFDFEKRRVAFLDTISVDDTYEKLTFLPSRDKSTIDNRKHMEIGGVKNNKGEPMLLLLRFDTGCMLSAIALNNKIGSQISNQLHNKTTNKAIGSYRIPTTMIKGIIDSLTIGSLALQNGSVTYSSENGVMDQMIDASISDGLLGFPFLVRFHLIVDYKNNIMYIKPNLYQKTGAMYKWDATTDSIYLQSIK